MRKKKPLFSTFLLLCLLISSILSPAVFAEEQPVDKPSLVALGDSITFGWNLYEGENPDISVPSIHAFPNYIANGAFDVSNLSWPGWTSTDLLNAISTDSSFLPAIKDADVITLNIGNNDLLQAAEISKLIKEGVTLTPELLGELQAKIETASLQLASNLQQIIGAVRSVNTEAPIIFYNIYNPFGEHVDAYFPGLHQIGDMLVGGVNSKVITPIASKAPGTILVDAFTAYDGKQEDYILPFPDAHPSVAGQQALASLADGALLLLAPEELDSEITSSTLEETEGPVTITVKPNYKFISSIKWLPGEKAVEDFATEGNILALKSPSFEVTENGIYTIYLKDIFGTEAVKTYEVSNIVETPEEEEPPIDEEPPVEEPPVDEEPPAEEPPVEEEPPAEEPVNEEPKGEEKETPVKEDPKTEDNTGKLPDTASSMYNQLAVGSLLIISGTALFFIYRRKVVRI